MMDGDAPAKCSQTNKDGSACNATPGPSGLCRWHSPEMADRIAEGRRRGGKARSHVARARKQLPAGLLTADEMRAVVCLTTAKVLAGSIEPPVATAVATLARAFGSLTEAARAEELAARLDDLEAAARRGGAA